MPQEFDVLVHGAGPAGATAARRLAELGYRVALVQKLRSQPLCKPRWETVSPNTAELLRHLMARDYFLLQDYLRPCRATVRWTKEHRHSLFVQTAILVERNGLDTLLRRMAAEAGVTMLERELGASEPVTATFVIDATGRLSGGKSARTQHGPRTLALTATVSKTSLEPWETRVESLDEGWFWAARTGEPSTTVTLFTCPELAAYWLGKNRIDAFRQALEKSSLRGRDALEVSSSLRGVEATVSTRPPLPTEKLMRIGDAALLQDPLASQGLHYALLSAQQASAAIHTCARTGDVALARAFIEANHKETLAHHVRTCAEIYRQQNVWTSGFWERRCDVAPAQNPEFAARPAPRLDYSARIALSPQIRWEITAVLEEDLIVPRMVLFHENLSRPVAFLAGQPVAELLKDLPATLTAGMLMRYWLARGLSPGSASRALTFLQQHEIVIAAR